MNSNRRERRKTASNNKSSKTTLSIGSALYIATEANDLATALLADTRDNAAKNPDVVYKTPVLLFSAQALAFGEAENVAMVFAEADLTENAFKAFDLTAYFGGKTVGEVADIFLKEEKAMHKALMYIVGGFAMAEAGVTIPDLLNEVGTSMETVFDLLGIARKHNG